MTQPTHTSDDARALLELESALRAEVPLPVDAHVIGEPITLTRIRNPASPRVGLLATCRRGDVTYELSFADVVPSRVCRRIHRRTLSGLARPRAAHGAHGAHGGRCSPPQGRG